MENTHIDTHAHFYFGGLSARWGIALEIVRE